MKSTKLNCAAVPTRRLRSILSLSLIGSGCTQSVIQLVKDQNFLRWSSQRKQAKKIKSSQFPAPTRLPKCPSIYRRVSNSRQRILHAGAESWVGRTFQTKSTSDSCDISIYKMNGRHNETKNVKIRRFCQQKIKAGKQKPGFKISKQTGAAKRC